MSKYAPRHGTVLSYRAVLSWFFEDSSRPLPSTSPLGHWRPTVNVYRYSFQHSEALKILTTTTWTGRLFVLTSLFLYVEFNLFMHIMPQSIHQSFHQRRRFNGGRTLCNIFVNCRPHNFIYTFFPSFSPTPYIHARGNIMGRWTCLVEFGLASFFLKPSSNLIVTFDYNHQITKESQDIGSQISIDLSNQINPIKPMQGIFFRPSNTKRHYKATPPLHTSFPLIHFSMDYTRLILPALPSQDHMADI